MNDPKVRNRYINRELSWLSFNNRVLQEAERSDNPAIERMRFLGIFSNNLDEFFRVRVANLRRALDIDAKSKTSLGFSTRKTLSSVGKRVRQLQSEFQRVYNDVILELESMGVQILNDEHFSEFQVAFATSYFIEEIQAHLVPIIISSERPFPDLRDGGLYMAVEIELSDIGHKSVEYALIEVPSFLPRFVIMPSDAEDYHVAFIDDIIRSNLNKVFRLFMPEHIRAFALKVTRDAEIDMDDDLSKSLMAKMSEGVAARKKGDFVRLVHDRAMPSELLALVKNKLGLDGDEDVIAGDRYQNRKDFIQFPSFGLDDAQWPDRAPLTHPLLSNKSSMIKQLLRKEVLLNFPYHDFDQVINLLREAAIDPDVDSIHINLYRVAQNSKIVNALISAAHNGKKVCAYIELSARFDEKHNIEISNVLREAGINVGFGVAGLKVHSKLILITRWSGTSEQRIAYIGTGNFHENSAKVFSDFGFLTADVEITQEVANLFSFFNHNYERPKFKRLVVSPYETRSAFNKLIRQEMMHAKSGKKGRIILKFNSLVDPAMIEMLYTASQAGVKIDLIIRGICSLAPGIKGRSENIRVRSIVGRDLEHARVLFFANAGNHIYYISSADWMTRNLDRRVEVSVPIRNPLLQAQIGAMLALQLKDNVRARKLDDRMKDRMASGRSNQAPVDSQALMYDYYAKQDVS